MLKFLKRIFLGLIGLVVLIVIGLYITGNGYIVKGVRVVYMTGHTSAFIDDYAYFENVEIKASGQPQPWEEHQDYNKTPATDRLQAIHSELGTVAFLIIKNDSIWHEYYSDGYGTDSRSNSFSMAKSVISAMLGRALVDGSIQSLDQPVSDFIPRYEGAATTVGDLSSMASGLDWTEHYTSPFSITARAYYDDDLGSTILGQGITGTPAKEFEYLSGNTQLLAMVLEAATGKPLEQYLSENFWKPMGFEHPALWQVDDAENQLPKAYCCIASNARDFARFGKLYKDWGQWNGKTILDSTFVAKSIVPRFPESPEYGYGFWLSDHMFKQIFVMRGILGQYVITIPKDDVIIVRLGHQRGGRSGRPFSDDFYVYLEEAYQMMEGS
ncbi:serine hydrolase domain-containing protein [Aureitalea marina]|uniref:Serine hydrolase n=1 Tax=Aureitalea marina TaxID=930804 RepID=A0A2S7KSL4_9FLAO|nr:serine hydrolase [Aureitalea marina]PQB02962.1 serine hydrolase [Aureitalea marina]PQB02965.1 serine hydrolase [Aureitalea marina]PQB05533.1 serine hydrolase [Aureitalea marina]